MNAPAARPVSLLERAAVTTAGLALALLMDRAPLPFVDQAAVEQAHASLSPVILGIMPFVVAYGIVEGFALLVPRLRRARHEARGRTWLDRISFVLAIAMAGTQAFAVVESLKSVDVLPVRGWETAPVLVATIVAGSCMLAAAGRWVSQLGLVNGFVLYWLLFVGLDFARHDPVHHAAFVGGAHDAAVLVASWLLGLAATGLALYRSDTATAPRVVDSAYRGAHVAPPVPVVPVPASSILPLVLAYQALGSLRALRPPLVLLQSDLVSSAITGGAVVAFTLLCGALISSPAEVAAFVARLGATTGPTARAEARAALRRSWPGTFATMLALFGAMLAHRHVPAGPVYMTAVALLGATVLDGAASLRAHLRAPDLVAIGELRAAHAVSTLRAALAAEGIPAKVTGVATLSLLQGFGPYAPARVFVRAADAERASALLRHWAAGDAKPMQPDASVLAGEPEAAFGAGRTAGLCALGALGVAVSFLPGGHATSPAREPRAEIAIVAVDDQADPLRGVDQDSLPEHVAVYTEKVPLGATHPTRVYARVSTEPPESNAQAWARVRPWLDSIPLPPGDRWTWEDVLEPIFEREDDERPKSLRVVGLRTFVLSGTPIVTTADVRRASAGLDEYETQAHVTVTFTPEAGERFHAFTSQWVGRRLAILVDGHVNAAPWVKTPIQGGRVDITIGPGYADHGLAAARELAASLGGNAE